MAVKYPGRNEDHTAKAKDGVFACLPRERHSIDTEVLKKRTASTFAVTFWLGWPPTGKSTAQHSNCASVQRLWRQRAAGSSKGEHDDSLGELSVA
jgi:hypothetical protein